MYHFQRARTLRKFASVHASDSNHFNQERSLSKRCYFKAALSEWRGLLAETNWNWSDSTFVLYRKGKVHFNNTAP